MHAGPGFASLPADLQQSILRRYLDSTGSEHDMATHHGGVRAANRPLQAMVFLHRHSRRDLAVANFRSAALVPFQPSLSSLQLVWGERIDGGLPWRCCHFWTLLRNHANALPNLSALDVQITDPRHVPIVCAALQLLSTQLTSLDWDVHAMSNQDDPAGQPASILPLLPNLRSLRLLQPMYLVGSTVVLLVQLNHVSAMTQLTALILAPNCRRTQRNSDTSASRGQSSTH